VSDLYISALAIEQIIDQIPTQRLAFATFEDGSVGLTAITEAEYDELRGRYKREYDRNRLPKHYQDQGA
jgi:hypothetical protein